MTLSIVVILAHEFIAAGQLREHEVSMDSIKAIGATEQLLVTTDRDDYIAGEVLWFSSWLIPCQNPLPAQHSAIARIEILNHAGVQVARATFRLDNCRGHGQMKLSDTLSSGIYKVRAYTNLMRNFRPAHWFEKNITIYNAYKNKSAFYSKDGQKYGSQPDSLTAFTGLNVIAGNKFSTREEVKVEILVPDVYGKAELCVTVVPSGSVRPHHIPDRSDMGAGAGNSRSLLYKPEYDCYYISGNLLTKTGQPSPAGETVFFSVPGKIPVLKYARTDEKGRFSFKMGLNERIDEFVLQSDTGDAYHIILESGFTGGDEPGSAAVDFSPATIPSHIGDMSVNARIAMVYSRSFVGKEIGTTGPYRKQLSFYGKHAKEVFVKDFVQLSNMEEIFFEIIPGVSLFRTGKRYEMQLKNSMGKVLYDTPPLMMIDGVIIRDASIIARLDHTEVERIDAVQDQYMVGDNVFSGIVNVVTKMADFRNIPLPPGAIRMQNNIFDSVHEFALPEHIMERGMDHEPDYRNTLYWNPDLQPDAEGKYRFRFLTSDATGSYVIMVQGFTSAGESVSGYKTIQVN